MWRNFPDHEVAYAGQPYIVDEFGGIKWIPSEDLLSLPRIPGDMEKAQNAGGVLYRLEGMIDVLLSYDHICGYCYPAHRCPSRSKTVSISTTARQKFDMARIARPSRKERR